MEELFLPVLHSFENNNVFTGSYGALRFKVTPAITMKNPKEVDMEASSMLCELWHGPFCYEKSEMEAQETFPLSEEGKENMRQFLLSHICGSSPGQNPVYFCAASCPSGANMVE